MARSLRRSRRAPKKGNSDFNDGDIVEIDRGHGTIARGRLAQLLTEGSSPNPRWLVKFDGQPYKDEEMYERAFGKLLQSAEEGDDSQGPLTTTASSNNKPSSKSGAVSGTSSEGEKSDTSSSSSKKKANKMKTKKKAAVQFEEDVDDGKVDNKDGVEDGLSDDSSPDGGGSKSDRASAREARSKRRQAKIDEELSTGELLLLAGKRKLGGAAGSTWKKLKGNTFDGDVTKMKLLTGTLFFYRGADQRRVEFVPRV